MQHSSSGMVVPRALRAAAGRPIGSHAPAPRAVASERRTGSKAERSDERSDGASSSDDFGGGAGEEGEGYEDEDTGVGDGDDNGGIGGGGVKRSRHAPAELPSTRGVSRYRPVFAVPSKVVRDPRFEASSGAYNDELFKKSYRFLDDKRAEELKALQAEARRTKDPERARELQGELSRRKQAAAESVRLAALKETQRSLKKGAQEAVSGGAKPFFPKQRELRELEAVEHFKALEASGGAAVEKALKKRRVKLSKKDRTKLPPRA